MTRGQIAGAQALALLAAIAIGSLLMLAAGQAPGNVWGAMVSRTFGDPYALGQVLLKASTLAFTGLAVALALDAGLFHIGAEGQVIAGNLVAGTLGAALPPTISPVVALPLVVMAAALTGALLGAFTGWLRAARGAHEVIVGILLNAIVAGVALWIGNAALFTGGTTRGHTIAVGAQLPTLGIAGSAANASVLIAVLAAVVVWSIRGRTRVGLAIAAVGQQPGAAIAAGVDVTRVRVGVMAAAGAIAALASTNLVLGHKHAFEEGLGRGTGYLGVAVALLARAHPLGVLIAALGLGWLSQAGLAVGDLVPKELTDVIIGVVVLAVAAAAPLAARLRGPQR